MYLSIKNNNNIIKNIRGQHLKTFFRMAQQRTK